MDGINRLSETQKELLRQFQETMNERDTNLAVASLESVDWNVGAAIIAREVVSSPPPRRPTQAEQVPPSVRWVRSRIASDMNSRVQSNPTRLEPERRFLLFKKIGTEAAIREAIVRFPDQMSYLLSSGSSAAYASAGRSASHVSNGNTGFPLFNGLLANMAPWTRSLHNRRNVLRSSHANDNSADSPLSESRSSRNSQNLTTSRQSTPGSNPRQAIRSDMNVATSDSESENDNDIFEDADSYSHLDNEIDSRQPANDDRVPLVPSEFSSIDEALHNFVAVFEARYGANHPSFYSGSLQNAVRDALDAPGRQVAERRPLAVYLHNDNSVASNIFAKNVMCSDLVAPLLKAQFITWPWDVSQRENKRKLFEWINSLNFRDLVSTLERLPDERYPLLVVLVKDKGVTMPVEVIWGSDSSLQVVDKLMNGLEQHQRIKSSEVAEERERIAREEIRQEQEREYEAALSRDRARQEQVERERNEQIAEEARRLKAEEDKANHERKLADSLPSEPVASEKNIATIRVRFPDGTMQTRRFRMSEPLRHVTVFVESKGYSLDKYRIWTSDVPKKNLVESFDLNRILLDLNWPVREQITVDEK